jgi:hypothetical protein
VRTFDFGAVSEDKVWRRLKTHWRSGEGGKI